MDECKPLPHAMPTSTMLPADQLPDIALPSAKNFSSGPPSTQGGGGTTRHHQQVIRHQSDKISHIDIGDDHIDTVISHIIRRYPILISKMTISIW